MNNQNNGNDQLNSMREEFNKRIDKKAFMGKTKKRAWEKQRRNRSI